jgi:hypothetical protein
MCASYWLEGQVSPLLTVYPVNKNIPTPRIVTPMQNNGDYFVNNCNDFNHISVTYEGRKFPLVLSSGK